MSCSPIIEICADRRGLFCEQVRASCRHLSSCLNSFRPSTRRSATSSRISAVVSGCWAISVSGSMRSLLYIPVQVGNN